MPSLGGIYSVILPSLGGKINFSLMDIAAYQSDRHLQTIEFFILSSMIDKKQSVEYT